jgi:hypothetical protein
MIKEIIKQLAAEQRQLKDSRKTGSNPSDEARDKSNVANYKVHRNATRITAALNLYHEMRGSEYRHNVPTVSENGFYGRQYDRDYTELAELCKFTRV